MALTKIRYKGLSDERTMTKKELGDAGHAVDNGLHFHRGNAWTQYMESPSDDMLAMLKSDGNFTVTDADAGDADGATIVAHDPTKADDTGKAVVDKSSKTGK